MSLKDRITEDMKTAMRAKDAPRLLTIRGLLAALKQREVDERVVLTDADVIGIVDKLVKQRKDSIEQFTQGGRRDLADKEAQEIRILETYLPPAADPALIERAVLEAIAETAAVSVKDVGRVMKAAMAKLAGQTIDGKTVNELVRQKLSSQPSS
jgi:uncharacterized protein YqeY